MTQDTDAKSGAIASWFDLAACCSGLVLAIMEAAEKARSKRKRGEFVVAGCGGCVAQAEERAPVAVSQDG